MAGVDLPAVACSRWVEKPLQVWLNGSCCLITLYNQHIRALICAVWREMLLKVAPPLLLVPTNNRSLLTNWPLAWISALMPFLGKRM